MFPRPLLTVQNPTLHDNPKNHFVKKVAVGAPPAARKAFMDLSVNQRTPEPTCNQSLKNKNNSISKQNICESIDEYTSFKHLPDLYEDIEYIPRKTDLSEMVFKYCEIMEYETPPPSSSHQQSFADVMPKFPSQSDDFWKFDPPELPLEESLLDVSIPKLDYSF